MKTFEKTIGKLFFSAFVLVGTYFDESVHSIGWIFVTFVVLLWVWFDVSTISALKARFGKRAEDKVKSNQDD